MMLQQELLQRQKMGKVVQLEPELLIEEEIIAPFLDNNLDYTTRRLIPKPRSQCTQPVQIRQSALRRYE